MTIVQRVEEIVATVPGAKFKLNFGDASLANFTVSGPTGSDTYAISKHGLLHVQLGGQDPVVARAVRRIKSAKPWESA